MTKKLNALRVQSLKYEPKHSKGSKNPGQLLINRHPDEGTGLYLAILPTGAKSWRYDWRIGQRRGVIVYGSYPQFSLEEARNLHIDARRLIARGLIPAMAGGQVVAKSEKQKVLTDNRFRAVAAEWYAAKIAEGEKSLSWTQNVTRWIGWANDAFGSRPLPEIEAPEILALVKRVSDEKGANSADNMRRVIASIWDHGIANLLVPKGFNPARAIEGAIIVPEPKHRPKLDARDIPAFLKAIEQHEREEMRLALKILVHCFTRKQELGEATWSELDLDAGLWTIPAARMKKKREHVIPLSTQVRAMFARLKELAGETDYVLPSPDSKKKPVHRNILNDALKAIGYDGEQFTPHSARSTAASLLADAGWDKYIIKAQLAHGEDSATDAAYFRNTYLDKRRELLQFWSDTLDGMLSGAKVVPIGSARAA